CVLDDPNYLIRLVKSDRLLGRSAGCCGGLIAIGCCGAGNTLGLPVHLWINATGAAVLSCMA
ncbi:hypothetical protein, partial [Vogesella fluminis]|uniref:hypothetical protein n=1 Tax=Vogesella fluminis TaxID=1069161 RepID=UPI001E30C965